MNSHFETVICNGCKAIEVAEVVHTRPWWTFLHTCSKCGYVIMEQEWMSAGHLWNDDMMRVLSQMKTSSVDVVICDAPYGVRSEVSDDKGKKNWDDKEYFTKNIKGWLKECMRVSKHTVVWFCANRMFPYIFNVFPPEYFLREHHWKKPKGSQFAGASNNRVWYSAEPILVFTKNRELTVKNFDDDCEWNYDDFEFSTVAKKTWAHPTVKQVGLIYELVSHYSKRGDTILDPFAGSGTLAEVAIKSGRKFIIVEQDPDHYKTILTRINNINSQIDLFGMQ